MAGLSLQQKQSQALAQTMSQRQIQSLDMLSKSSDDLSESIYEAAEKNPALEVRRDARGGYTSGTGIRVSARSSQAAQEASDRSQAALEAKADARTSLPEHLLSQFLPLPLPESMIALGTALIHNLDAKGFHILSPVSLLDTADPLQTPALLEKCLRLIQGLDPVGTCTKGTEESLLVQARLRDDAPRLALFLLDGHLSFLEPLQPEKILRKIAAYRDEQAALFGGSTEALPSKEELTEEAVAKAVAFIQTLDPFPAREFGTDEARYIAPDVYVEKSAQDEEKDDAAQGIVAAGGRSWRIRLSRDSIPSVRVNPEMLALSDSLRDGGEGMQALRRNIQEARDFVQSIAYRQSTVLQACGIIVRRQHEFFEKGPGHLVPLRQQDVAQELGVHETTISRMANSKYLQCEWGLFEIKYFFTGAASRSGGDTDVSRDKVMREMQEILSEAEGKSGAKKMSDQKLCDALAERGIRIARRTVAKYRSQLNISSSYGR